MNSRSPALFFSFSCITYETLGDSPSVFCWNTEKHWCLGVLRAGKAAQSVRVSVMPFAMRARVR